MPAKTIFSTWTRKIFPPSFQDEILIMEIWMGLADGHFYQKQQEFISGITPIRGKKWHNSVQAPRGLQGSPDLLLVHESGWQPESFHVPLQNEAATSSSSM